MTLISTTRATNSLVVGLRTPPDDMKLFSLLACLGAFVAAQPLAGRGPPGRLRAPRETPRAESAVEAVADRTVGEARGPRSSPSDPEAVARPTAVEGEASEDARRRAADTSQKLGFCAAIKSRKECKNAANKGTCSWSRT